MSNKNNIPVYISLTSIFDNQDKLYQTLQSIVVQKHHFNKIYLHLSEDAYLLDKGFKDKKINNEILYNFLEQNNNIIEIQWVENIGSYRKLLPLLKQKWNENCFIITIDDDTIYDEKLIEKLLNDYKKYKCVICYRGFTPKLKSLHQFQYYRRDILKNLNKYNFPTGKGGILYKPEFFYKTNDLIFNHEIYLKECRTKDDIWFYLIRILNDVNCFIDNKKYMIKDITGKGLYATYNRTYKSNKNNITNTKSLITTMKLLNMK